MEKIKIKSILNKVVYFWLVLTGIPALRAQQDVEFIVIAYTGSLDEYVVPIIITYDTINKIDFTEGIYDQHRKYQFAYIHVVSYKYFEILFNSLNIYKTWKERPLNYFDKTECGYMKLIVDFRGKDGKDYEMITIRTLQETFLLIKMIYCLVTLEEMNEKLAEHLKGMYKVLYRFWNVKEIDEELRCK